MISSWLMMVDRGRLLITSWRGWHRSPDVCIHRCSWVAVGDHPDLYKSQAVSTITIITMLSLLIIIVNEASLSLTMIDNNNSSTIFVNHYHYRTTLSIIMSITNNVFNIIHDTPDHSSPSWNQQTIIWVTNLGLLVSSTERAPNCWGMSPNSILAENAGRRWLNRDEWQLADDKSCLIQ